MERCDWCKHELEVEYHDSEWGVPLFDDQLQFEFLMLESAQAGLSWLTILKKRQNYRKAFDNFDPVKVSEYNKNDVERLLGDVGIVRNKLKVAAAINNARVFLEVQRQHGSFCNYIWDFVDGKPIQNEWKVLGDLPATTPESEKLAKDLKKRGFKFLGPTTVYAHMQAAGLVNDHLVSCFRYPAIREMGEKL